MDNVNGGPRRSARTPWQVTRSVWYAMFMREAISRTMSDRMGWFWMIFEPVAYIGIMIAIRTFIRGDQLIVNADFIPWLITGLLGFALVREGMMRGMGAVDGNKALFAYRQVQPVDPVLVRNFLEGMLRSFIFLIFIGGGLMLGLDMYPDNALRAMAAWLSLWSLGLGLGLVTSVAASLVPELGRVFRMLALPLMILSGVIFPLNALPHWLLEYLMINPIPHGLETLRLGFFDKYQVVHGTSMLYFWFFTFTLIALGLLMHLRFIDRLKAQ
ncbi:MULTISPECIES: ABC transporter permease [Halomonadaceae]|uniref:ABC transporter permease n=1 Tax=Halomonadaceae TaxID=28256 RepID=UPI0012F06FAF|nr:MULTISPECIES: ABC transporter permease [Halomonas]CAD5265078.1 Transport permease protein [Halomonas sp. 156]CAD5266098.1 Transport permease protein [Halomonas sp. I3]CAD5283618.1 Transport permease protein [Halomonas sp. 113]CAD5285056.1 Transport permease protein [Halomonas sp. 59]VXB24675.1 Transport permease protein [Halomonas titanicae]